MSGFHDGAGFSGLTADLLVRGANVIYEAHPFFDLAINDTERDASFGFLASRVPVYAGEWGLQPEGSGCVAVTQGSSVTEQLFAAIRYFDAHNISWTASSFEPGSLVADFADYLPTTLSSPWTCDAARSANTGMGEAVVLATTGDPSGFGALRAGQIANLAGGPAGPLSPGELVAIFVEQLGPVTPAVATAGPEGKLPVLLAGIEVLINGSPAPILQAGAFQIQIQAPWELTPGSDVTIQVMYRGTPSNRATVGVAEATAELFSHIATGYATALNEDGSLNGPRNPASAGGIIVLFGAGCGPGASPIVTGGPSPAPHPLMTLPIGTLCRINRRKYCLPDTCLASSDWRKLTRGFLAGVAEPVRVLCG